jgi:hypothetical protein
VNCEHCRWFDLRFPHLEIGLCRRRSPIAVQYPWPLWWELDDGTTTQSWPEVRPRDWCGEFAATAIAADESDQVVMS